MINMTKKVSERLEQAHDTLSYTHAALQDIKANRIELREFLNSMDVIEKIQYKERMRERMKRLNQSVRVALAYTYHIN